MIEIIIIVTAGLIALGVLAWVFLRNAEYKRLSEAERHALIDKGLDIIDNYLIHNVQQKELVPLPLSSLHRPKLQRVTTTQHSLPSPIVTDLSEELSDENVGDNDNLSVEDLDKSTDEKDAKIVHAFVQIQRNGRKPTGTEIARITGIPMKTVYRRAEKLRSRGVTL